MLRDELWRYNTTKEDSENTVHCSTHIITSVDEIDEYNNNGGC